MLEGADVLVLDTATPAVTAAVVRVAPGAVEARSVRVADPSSAGARRHGELLAPAVAAVLAAGGLPGGALAAVVAGTGPGPFTGLRVGLVTAAALADALHIPAYGVCSLDALATPAAGAGRVLAATDARRREVYWAVYEGATRLAGPAVGRPAEVAAAARELGVERACGAGARQYSAVLGLPVSGPDSPDPVALAALAAQRVLTGAPADPLTPLYLRQPDAAEPRRPKPVTAARPGSGERVRPAAAGAEDLVTPA